MVSTSLGMKSSLNKEPAMNPDDWTPKDDHIVIGTIAVILISYAIGVVTLLVRSLL